MLAKYIRMRTARSAATASHPCVERSTEGIKKKNPVDVTPLSFLQSFFSKKRRSSRDNGAARQSAFFAKLSFLRKKNPSETSSTGVLPSFFQKRRSSTPNEACATIHFLCQAFFFVKESGVT